jgi:cytochrome b561
VVLGPGACMTRPVEYGRSGEEGKSLKQHLVRSIGIAGAIIAIQSVVWEYARMRPDYDFIVEPWSIRGFETVHGSIAVAAGVLALAAVLAVSWDGATKPAAGTAITALIAVGATAIATVFGGGTYDITPGFFLVTVLAIIIGTVIYRMLSPALRRTAAGRSFGLRILVLVVIFVIIGVVVNALVGGKEISFAPWMAIGVVFLLLAALSLSSEPRELAANRMLMFSAITGAVIIATSAGATRSTLVRLQVEAVGVPSSYQDTQVTWGHLYGVIGLSLVFLAAVALWARRRDAILAADRAAKQREAAEASAAEIAAAMEKVAAAQNA